jgi:hypothetical protein
MMHWFCLYKRLLEQTGFPTMCEPISLVLSLNQMRVSNVWCCGKGQVSEMSEILKRRNLFLNERS